MSDLRKQAGRKQVKKRAYCPVCEKRIEVKRVNGSSIFVHDSEIFHSRSDLIALDYGVQ